MDWTCSRVTRFVSKVISANFTQAIIDLKDNVLRIYDEAVPFLAEHELPAKAKWDGGDDNGPASKPETKPAAQPLPPASRPAVSNPSASISASRPSVSRPETQFPAESIARLQELGASREEAVGALQAAGGSVDGAASILFNF